MRSAAEETLAFEAIRYVLEEMPPPERDAFEHRLADDQAAREAVAEAVWLCEAVQVGMDDSVEGLEKRVEWQPQACFDPVLAPALASQADGVWLRPAQLKPTRWAFIGAAVALAASVVVAVVAGFGRDGRSASVASVDGASVDADAGKQLAVAWANSPSLAELNGDDAQKETSNEPGDSDGEPASLHVSPATGADWLLEALTASRSSEAPVPSEPSEPTGAATRGEG